MRSEGKTPTAPLSHSQTFFKSIQTSQPSLILTVTEQIKSGRHENQAHFKKHLSIAKSVPYFHQELKDLRLALEKGEVHTMHRLALQNLFFYLDPGQTYKPGWCNRFIRSIEQGFEDLFFFGCDPGSRYEVLDLLRSTAKNVIFKKNSLNKIALALEIKKTIVKILLIVDKNFPTSESMLLKSLKFGMDPNDLQEILEMVANEKNTDQSPAVESKIENIQLTEQQYSYPIQCVYVDSSLNYLANQIKSGKLDNISCEDYLRMNSKFIEAVTVEATQLAFQFKNDSASIKRSHYDALKDLFFDANNRLLIHLLRALELGMKPLIFPEYDFDSQYLYRTNRSMQLLRTQYAKNIRFELLHLAFMIWRETILPKLQQGIFIPNIDIFQQVSLLKVLSCGLSEADYSFIRNALFSKLTRYPRDFIGMPKMEPVISVTPTKNAHSVFCVPAEHLRSTISNQPSVFALSQSPLLILKPF